MVSCGRLLSSCGGDCSSSSASMTSRSRSFPAAAPIGVAVMGAQCADGLPELADRVAQFHYVAACHRYSCVLGGQTNSLVAVVPCLPGAAPKPSRVTHHTNVIYNTVREEFEGLVRVGNSGSSPESWPAGGRDRCEIYELRGQRRRRSPDRVRGARRRPVDQPDDGQRDHLRPAPG